MWRSRLSAAALALVAGVAAAPVPPAPAEQSRVSPPGLVNVCAANSVALPQTRGWELVVSRCVVCHSLETATQQRQGPRGWAEIVDRMIIYGAPIPPEDREILLAYLVRHFRNPAGR